jgi:threonine/homoserine/homoserine lactone efflux protein
MANAIGQILPAAVGVAISPLPIIAVVLMLGSARGRLNGPLFIVGWLIGLAVLGTIVLAIAGPSASSSSGPSKGASVVQIILGALLLLVAVAQWRKRPRPGVEPAPPKWMATIASFTPVQAAGIGAILAAVNPKNLLLAVSAATTIAQTGISGTDQAIAYAVFAVIASVGVAAPVVIFFTMGDRATALLDRLETWMSDNNAVIMSVLCLVIAAKFIGQGIAGL